MTKENYDRNSVLNALRAGYNKVKDAYLHARAAVQDAVLGPQLAFAGMPSRPLEERIGEYDGLQKARDLSMHVRGNRGGKKKGSGRLHAGISYIIVRAGNQNHEVDLNS